MLMMEEKSSPVEAARTLDDGRGINFIAMDTAYSPAGLQVSMIATAFHRNNKFPIKLNFSLL